MHMKMPYPFNELTLAEEKRAALAYVTEAFAEAIMDGIEADCFAQAALFAAFQELTDTYGEEATAVFAEKLPERIRQGEFTVRVTQ